MRFWWIAVALLACGAASAQVNLNAPISEKPTVASELRRGIDAAFDCTLKHMDQSEAMDCVLDAQHINQQQHAGHDAFDVGLYFEAWRHFDIVWTVDTRNADTNSFAASQVDSTKAYAASTFTLFRNYRKALGVTVEQILSQTELNDGGKAAVRARFAYWDSQPARG